eukprot:g16943.t1
MKIFSPCLKKSAQHDIICEYKGFPDHKVTVRQVKNPTYKSDYIFTSGSIAVDAQHPVTKEITAGGHINDNMDEKTANCTFKVIGDKVYVVATRPIPPHAELTLLYGEEYWMCSKWSLSILRSASKGYGPASLFL